MSKHTVRERLLASTMIGGSALLALAAPAFAADQPTAVQEVVVTGSRIPQPGLTSASPLSVVNNEEVKLQGTTSAETLLNTLPQVFASQGAYVSNGSSGTATVNLRNLGSKRTLVLIDGRRMGPGDPLAPVPDLNNIPATLIDRVELVTGGASAVYGSDAIGGVVNFIMKHDFEGVRLDAQYSFNGHNNRNNAIQALNQHAVDPGFPAPSGNIYDGKTWNVTLVTGANAADGKGNVTAFASYRHQDPILEAARDYSYCSLTPNHARTSLSCAGSQTDFPGTIVDANPGHHGNGTAIGCPGGPSCLGGGSNNYTYSIASGPQSFIPYQPTAITFNFAPYNYFQRPDDRYQIGGFAHYQIRPWADVYSEVSFTDDHTLAQIAPSGIFLGTTFKVNCNNPFLSAQQVNEICTLDGLSGSQQASVLIGRRNIEGGGRVANFTHDTFRIVEGIRGDFAEAWHYDLYGTYTKANFQTTEENYFSNSKIQNALLTTNGTTCLNGPANCSPYNLWAGTSSAISQASLNYLQVPGIQTGFTTEQVVSGNITGDLGHYGYKSPWAKDGVGVSLGAEYRRDELAFQPDNEIASGDLAGAGGAAPATHGAVSVKEIFGEVRVPIVQDAAFAKDLSFEGGYRHSDYDPAGGVNSYKAAVDWQIIDDVRLRGSFQRAVRAPNVNELFSPLAVGLFSGNDPCAGAVTSGHTPSGATLAGCQASGVTSGQFGTVPKCISSQCNALFGGNTHLKVEESDTKSYGVVFTPTFFRGFSLTVDYYDIDVKHAIGAPPAGVTLNSCIFGGSAASCALIHRDPTNGSIWTNNAYVNAQSANLGFFRTTGLDLEANYHTDLSAWGLGDHGSVRFNLVGTYTNSFDIQTEPGVAVQKCAGYYGVTCGTPPFGTPVPKWRHKLRATWVTPWNTSFSLDWRYIGGSNLDANQGKLSTASNFNHVDAHIPAYSYVDLSGTWKIHDGYNLRWGVENLFDKDPPIISSVSAPTGIGNGNTLPGTYDALGRTFFIGITADW